MPRDDETGEHSHQEAITTETRIIEEERCIRLFTSTRATATNKRRRKRTMIASIHPEVTKPASIPIRKREQHENEY